jgi:hypothetical protein
MTQTKKDTLVFHAGDLGVRMRISPRMKYICWEASNIGNRKETTKTTQHEQGYKSGYMERVVSV